MHRMESRWAKLAIPFAAKKHIKKAANYAPFRGCDYKQVHQLPFDSLRPYSENLACPMDTQVE